MIEVLSVASEIYPLIKTGGLADVAGALPGALAEKNIAMRSLVPGYPAVMAQLGDGREVAQLDDLYGGPARLVAGRAGGLDLIALDAPHLYDRPGNPYMGPNGIDWPDNWQRFAGLSWVAAQLTYGLVDGYRPKIIHAHDWQAGLVPAYIKFGPDHGIKTIITVHNMAFMGLYEADIFPHLRLPPQAMSIDGVEFYHKISYLKAGIECADCVTTVSPQYADEIRTPEFGNGFQGLLNGRADTVHGILNGIDMSAWNPAIDPMLKQNYTSATLPKRIVNKTVLVEKFGLDGRDGPLFCVVSRLTDQKGMDLLISVADDLVAMGARLCVLGSGDPALEAGLRAASERHPGKIGVIFGYDEALSHMMQGGADAILIPSRFEPCGLTQLYGLRYGCIPVVSRVGGLADTVIDANPAAIEAGVATGLQFVPDSAPALLEAIRKTIKLYQNEKLWRKLQRRAMKSDVSWTVSAGLYAELYAKLVGQKHDD